jgi:cytochrome P450
VLGDAALPRHEHLDRLTYLKLCIRETLRLYPSAHIFGRKAEEEAVVGGFVIPKGSNVLMSPYYLGRDPQQWGPDADLYRPERHLPTDPLAATRSKFAWMPFGAGPRMCLGASLAMTEATACVAGMMTYADVC